MFMKQNERRTAFILAAGMGTRLKELTSDKPKALVEVNDKPMLEIAIDNLISQKFNHIVINVHHFADKIIDFINSKKYDNVEIEISDETDCLYNTGGAIIKALPYFKESKAVLIHNVDIISDINFQDIYDKFMESDDAAWLITQDRNNKRKLVFDENDRFVGRLNLETNEYDGDTPIKDNFKQLSFSGLHIIKPEHFKDFELKACYVFDLYKEIIKHGTVRSEFSKSNDWFDLGTEEQLNKASLWLMSRDYFITKITDYIIENYQLEKDSVTIIFPNKRAALMLRKELERKIGGNIWLPQILSIQEAMSMWSEMQLVENIDVIFELLKVMNPNDMSSYSNLFGLASQMAKDFDEIDQYNIDAHSLFNYLKEYKTMDTWMPNEEKTSVEENYLKFFKSLHFYYENVRNSLTNKKCGYYGMITRKLANISDEELNELVGNNKIIFAGFNALTATEEDIIVKLVNNEKAVILWDLDKYYFEDDKQEAGFFAKNFFKKHRNIPQNFVGDYFNSKKKEINIIGVSGSTVQASALQLNLSRNKNKIPQNEVVVLADESLLIPVLNSIPDNYNNIQVTMGYPYSKTILHQFMCHLFSFQKYINEKENTIYFWELKRLLETEIVKVTFNTEELSSLTKSLNHLAKQSTYNFAISKINEHFNNRLSDFISILSEKWTLENCIQNIKKILIFIDGALSTNINFVKNQISIAARIVNKIERLLKEYNSLIQIDIIETLYKQSANEMSIKLESHNEGMQIMGLLETRNLDFNVVNILSVNEGTLPQSKSSNSLIPYDLRIGYNLPIYKNKQAVYAYHFYRLLQNAKKINIYYNTLADDMGAGEQSRFIRQIIHEMPEKTKGNKDKVNIVECIYKNPKIDIKKNSKLEVHKNENILNKIKNMVASENKDGDIKGLSPTSISCYLRCPMQFYLKYIEKIQDNNAEELIQSNVIGNIIHKTFEVLYSNFGNNEVVTKECYTHIVNSKLKEAFKESLISNKLPDGLPNSGFNHLTDTMVHKLIDNFISYENNYLESGNEFTIVELEGNLYHKFNIDGTPVYLSGFADRIDKTKDDTIRILDYKSGSVDKSDVQIGEIADKAEGIDILSKIPEKALQLLIYKYLYKMMNDNIDISKIQPAILGLLKNGDVLFKLINKSSNFNDDNFVDSCNFLFESLFKEILNKDIPFVQTADENKCSICSYTSVCKRYPKSGW